MWSTRGRRHLLPIEPKAIIGRQHELGTARELLSQDNVRLLTFTGPPGVGKTRLAIELANEMVDDFSDGGCFVDLAPIADWHQVTEVIAHRLDLGEFDRRVAAEVLEEYLRDRELLLLVDNFEHVLDAADIIARVLARCPGLKVVATSREPLHLRWERELGVPPLPLPTLADGRTSAEAISTSAAVQLFVDRAQAVSPDFVLGDTDAPAVAEICQRLDGLPLAIELAAARIKVFPPRALLRRITRAQQAEASGESALSLLAGQQRDLPARHQTLLRAINWSYELLGPDEQLVLRGLSVFVGGCSLEAAEGVATDGLPDGLELLMGLVDKSLLSRDEQPDGEPRFRLLETIRAFAAHQLELRDETADTRARHAQHYLELVERAAPELVGPHQQSWFTRFERERENLLAVERWATAQDDVDTTVRLGASLWPFWLAREDPTHTRDRVQAILRILDRVPPTATFVDALHGAGLMAEKLGDYATCRSLLARGVSVARELRHPRALAAVLDSLGRQTFIEGRYAEARVLLEESHALLRDTDNRVGLARVLSHLGFLEFLEGHTEAARAIFERGLAIARTADDQHRVAEFMDNLGNTFEAEGEFEQASHAFQAAISIWRELGQGHWLAMALNNLGKVELRRGELDLARRHLLEALSLAHRLGNRRRLAYTLAAIGALATAEGDQERATRLQAVASAAMAQIGTATPSGEQPVPAPSGTPMSLEAAVEETLANLNAQMARARATAMDGESRQSPRARQRRPADGGGLTRREYEVVQLVTAGYTNRQISEQLVITEGTAENYVQRVLTKLGFKNRAQIAVWAIQNRLGPRS